MSALKCKKCLSVGFYKFGHTRGMQRYKCKEYGCQFTDSPRRGVDPALRASAIILYAYYGLSMSKIAQLCQVSVVAVLNWIKEAALQGEPLTDISSSDVVMIDEIWHFVNGQKKKLWSWRAVDGITRQPLGWPCGHRGDSTLKKLLDRLNTKTCIFVTDEWSGFFRRLPADRHV